jgi:hypothetical protein
MEVLPSDLMAKTLEIALSYVQLKLKKLFLHFFCVLSVSVHETFRLSVLIQA